MGSKSKDNDSIIITMIDKFIRPLVHRLIPDNETGNVYSALDAFFGSDTRDVTKYKIINKVHRVNGTKIKGPDNKRSFKSCWFVLVRYDREQPLVVDVEFYHKDDFKKSYYYRMRPEEYRKYVAPYIKRIDKKDEKQ